MSRSSIVSSRPEPEQQTRLVRKAKQLGRSPSETGALGEHSLSKTSNRLMESSRQLARTTTARCLLKSNASSIRATAD
jgi:hypothetical protein